MSKNKAAEHNGLRWLGGDEPTRWIPGTPARDLDAHDLEREVFKEAHLHPGDKGFDKAKAGVVESLTRGGLYEPADVDAFDPNPPGANAPAAPAPAEPLAEPVAEPKEPEAPPSPEPEAPAPAEPKEN